MASVASERRGPRPAPRPLRRADLATLALTYAAGGVTTSIVVSQFADAWVVLLAAVIMYSATGELALVAVLSSGGSMVAGVLSGLLVSARFGLLCIALAQRFRRPWPERAAAAFVSVDPVVAVALEQPSEDGVRRTYWRVSWWMFAGWVFGSVVGLAVGSWLDDPATYGLDVVIPASLVAILANTTRSRDAAVAATLGAAITLVLVPATPGGVPVLASVVGAALALAVKPRPLGGPDPAAPPMSRHRPPEAAA